MSSFSGLDLLATAVVALDDAFIVRYANPAAENLFATGAKSLNGQPFLSLFSQRAELERALDEARITHWDYSAQNVTYSRAGREPIGHGHRCVYARNLITMNGVGQPHTPRRARHGLAQP